MHSCKPATDIPGHLLTKEPEDISYSQIYETTQGTLILRKNCSPAFVEHLRADDGLRAFARLPEREHQLLLELAAKPGCTLTLAYTPAGEIVGELCIVPADAWWSGVAHLHEIGLEVSYNWRRLGIARELLSFVLDADLLERHILLAIGLSWHWDVERAGLHPLRYRQLIAHVLQRYDFKEYATTEPNVNATPANILLARIGEHVAWEDMYQFFERLLSTEEV